MILPKEWCPLQFNITRETLVAALEHTFASTPAFAPYFVPLALEKLSSDVRCNHSTLAYIPVFRLHNCAVKLLHRLRSRDGGSDLPDAY